MAEKVNLAEKLASFSDHWAPRIVARYNDNEVRLVKVEGEFMWHQHDDTDELFLVIEGALDIELRDRTVHLQPGELFVVQCAHQVGIEPDPHPASRASPIAVLPASRTSRFLAWATGANPSSAPRRSIAS